MNGGLIFSAFFGILLTLISFKIGEYLFNKEAQEDGVDEIKFGFKDKIFGIILGILIGTTLFLNLDNIFKTIITNILLLPLLTMSFQDFKTFMISINTEIMLHISNFILAMIGVFLIWINDINLLFVSIFFMPFILMSIYFFIKNKFNKERIEGEGDHYPLLFASLFLFLFLFNDIHLIITFLYTLSGVIIFFLGFNYLKNKNLEVQFIPVLLVSILITINIKTCLNFLS